MSIACLSLGTTVLKAQDDDVDPRGKFQFGMKAGMNYSNVWDEKGQDFRADAKVGFAGGIFFGIPIGTFLGFQPEILLSQKGFQGSGTLFDTPYSFSRTTTYLDIPLQLELKPIRFLTVLVGPQYSYLLHEKDVYTYGANSSAQEQAFNNDNIRKNILGFVGGADINISHVVVSARMGWDFQANNGDGTSYTPRYKNKWIQLTVGFKI
ncbi:MAG TPA: porin family protein [Bacteroidia bacterium]|jgi:hypothetical protein|nr:porin family protein [Bacteroidia bacterium]